MSYNYTMSIEISSKINHLLSSQPSGIVFQSSWLAANGYSYGLQQKYRESRWLESIGQGAMIRTGDRVSYEGAIYALQRQTGLSIHPGGRTALTYLGKAHYLEINAKRVTLFGGTDEKLPVWFEKRDWGVRLDYNRTSFLPPELGLTELELKNFSIRISGAARAILECLYLARGKQDLIECYELMEGLNNLRPDQVQTLLERCESVKVKRLFLFMAEKAGHNWLNYLKLDQIDLGSGKRSIIKGGVFVDTYQITVPQELAAHD